MRVLSNQNKKHIDSILSGVYSRTNYDFRGYRLSTMRRRIARRFFYTKTKNFREYLDYISENPEEALLLLPFLTISVTEFFRNKEYWQIFKRKYIRILFKDGKKTIRIWCAGCSSGEEAYSLAVLLKERASAENLNFKIKITATDISGELIQKARAGIYTKEKILRAPYKNTLKKYFHKITKKEMKAGGEIKKMIDFKKHSLVNDAFFKKLDLIVCRNVFIYFSRALQNKIFFKFEKSLNKNGLLWLGKAESLPNGLSPKFTAVNTKIKLYRKLF